MRSSLIYLVKWIRADSTVSIGFCDTRNEANELCRYLQSRFEDKSPDDPSPVSGRYEVEVIGRAPTQAQLSAAQYAKNGRR